MSLVIVSDILYSHVVGSEIIEKDISTPTTLV